MERAKAIELLKNAVLARGYEVGPFIEAVCMAISALEGKDTNVPTNSALDHIHNVVRDDAYRRGYEQGKADANCPEIPDSWIPVSERLPETSEDILILLDDYKNMSVGRYYAADGEWYADFGEGPFDGVVAWMPLPEPYRKEP